VRKGNYGTAKKRMRKRTLTTWETHKETGRKVTEVLIYKKEGAEERVPEKGRKKMRNAAKKERKKERKKVGDRRVVATGVGGHIHQELRRRPSFVGL
jgi:cell fate regulator YaaT (PSP1 superfamily)